MSNRAYLEIVGPDPAQAKPAAGGRWFPIDCLDNPPDSYVAYPMGLKGVVVGQGDFYESALDDVKSANKFHVETFGLDEIDSELTQSKIDRNEF